MSAAQGQIEDALPHVAIRVEIMSEHHKDKPIGFDALRVRLDTMIKNQIRWRYGFIVWAKEKEKDKKKFRDTLVLRVEDSSDDTGNHYLHAWVVGDHPSQPYTFKTRFESVAERSTNDNVTRVSPDSLVRFWALRVGKLLDTEGEQFVRKVFGVLPINAAYGPDSSDKTAIWMGLTLEKFELETRAEFLATMMVWQNDARRESELQLWNCTPATDKSICYIKEIYKFQADTFKLARLDSLLKRIELRDLESHKRRLYLVSYTPVTRTSSGTAGPRP